MIIHPDNHKLIFQESPDDKFKFTNISFKNTYE